MDVHQLVNIFCDIDDFCNELEHHCQNYMLSGPAKSNRAPSCCVAISEIMTILVMFQMSRFRDFKNFYNGFLKFYHKDCFPKLPSYERFVHLMSRAIFPLTIFTPVYATLTPVVYPFVTLNVLKGTQLLMPSQNMERPPLAGSLA